MSGHSETIGHRASEFTKKYIGFSLFDLEQFIDQVGEWGVSRALACFVIFFGLLGVLSLE